MKYLHVNRFKVLIFDNLRYNNTNSSERNNIINNQETPIEVSSAPHNNEVYNNAISKSPTAGITAKAGSSENKIYNNIIDNTQKMMG
jgi:hypothetical protein